MTSQKRACGCGSCTSPTTIRLTPDARLGTPLLYHQFCESTDFEIQRFRSDPGPFCRKRAHLSHHRRPRTGCRTGQRVAVRSRHRAKHALSTRFATGAPQFVPPGHPTIAHRFIGGLRGNETAKAPGGATDMECDSVVDPSRGHDMLVCDHGHVSFRISFVPNGTCRVVAPGVPPLKRWAIVGCP